MSGDFIHRFEQGDPDNLRTLLLLHGTGGDEHSLLPLGRAIAPGAALLSPRGRVLENGMPRFFRRLAEGVFDLPDLRVRTDELAQFVEQAVARYGLAPDSVTAVGFSNGANIAGSLLLRHPGLVKSAILFRAMVPFEPDQLPDLHGTRVWIGAGRLDPIVPVANSARLAELLERAGAGVALDWRQAGHQLADGEVEAAAKWLQGTTQPASR
jgi:phospholipase/carboxylesterase